MSLEVISPLCSRSILSFQSLLPLRWFLLMRSAFFRICVSGGYVVGLGELVGAGVVFAGAPLGPWRVFAGDRARLGGLRARGLAVFFLHASGPEGD
jgi:hypothetical protein